MLNRRMRTFLTLMLAGAMVLSEPAASWAAADKAVEKDSQSEDSDSEEKDEEDSKSGQESKKTDKKDDKSKKKKVSGNSVSSDKASSNSLSSGKAVSKVKAPDEDSEDDEEKPKVTVTARKEERDMALAAEEEKSDEEVGEEKTAEEETSSEGNAQSYTNPFRIEGTGISEGRDWSFNSETGVLTISTNSSGLMTIGMNEGATESKSSLSVNSTGQGASLSLNGIHINTSVDSAINVAGSGNVNIYLGGNNILNAAGSGSSIRINNGVNATLDGTGVFSGDPVNGSVIIKGGNIQASVPNAKNVSGNQLSQKLISGLSVNTLYSVSINTVPDMADSYKNGIYSDQNGNVALYLPENYQAVPVGNILVVSAASTGLPSPSVTPELSPTGTMTPTPPASPAPDLAYDTYNGLYWIDNGTTYRSGATLQFYATGDGYGPEEPQQINKIVGSTRYIPVSWSVEATSSTVSGNTKSVSGKWKQSDREETSGQSVSGNYTSGEYRYKASFILNTTGINSVPYTLRVNYKRQTRGKNGWKDDGATASQSRNFYIRNTTATATIRPTSTTYVHSTVTTAATRSSVSTNAGNASTGDETPIGTLIMLLAAAAISGTAVFRKKKMRK